MLAALFTAHKEFLILIRDKGGLAVILLMPLALVFIVSLVQDSAWKASNTEGLEVIIVDQDQGPFGEALAKGLAEKGLARVLTELDGRGPTLELAEKALAGGELRLALVIPPGASAQLFDQMEETTTRLFDPESLNTGRPWPASKPIKIGVLLTPGIQGPLRRTIMATMNLVVQEVEIRILFSGLVSQLQTWRSPPLIGPWGLTIDGRLPWPTIGDFIGPPPGSLVHLEAAGRSREPAPIIPTSVQHNVPAWTIFGMFFILIPLAGSLIRERNDGTLARLSTMPVSRFSLMLGRLFLFSAVGYVQFGLLLGMGLFVLPLAGLAPLTIGPNLPAILFVAGLTALAAVSFGYLLGQVFSTPEKAALFGATTIVILSALGGIMVPAVLMPAPLRLIGAFSPLGWGMQAFSELFVNNHSLSDVQRPIIYLSLFTLACLGAALIWEKKRI